MRRVVIVLLAILCGVLVAWAAPPPGYRQAWADEFNGRTLDSSKWSYRTDSKHWSKQKPGNVSVSEGNLVLMLRKERAGDKEYTGGGVISKQAFRFGYYESRFRIQAGKGWHSSFWMMGSDGSGGTGTTKTALELDVIENDSIDLGVYGVNVHKWQSGHESFGHKRVQVAPPLSEFHVFGCEYTPTLLKFYLDGNVVQSVDLSGRPHSDLNIWLTSIASRLGNTNEVDGGKLPGRVEFDYVRYYAPEKTSR